jgi:DNA-directed RNA polymerase subunit RPC12/RpoP
MSIDNFKKCPNCGSKPTVKHDLNLFSCISSPSHYACSLCVKELTREGSGKTGDKKCPNCGRISLYSGYLMHPNACDY